MWIVQTYYFESFNSSVYAAWINAVRGNLKLLKWEIDCLIMCPISKSGIFSEWLTTWVSISKLKNTTSAKLLKTNGEIKWG